MFGGLKCLSVIAGASIATVSFAQASPSAGYSTAGLADPRSPWEFDWANPDREWLLLGSDAEGADWYIQLSSDVALRKQPKSYRKLWLKTDYSKVKSEKARDSKALWSINCDADTYTTISQTWYLPNGTVEGSRSYPPQHIIPESMASLVAKRVCSQ